MKYIMICIISLFLFSTCDYSVTKKVLPNDGFNQPLSIPGTFEYRTDEMPSVAEIASRPAPSFAVYGIYTWHWELKFDPYLENFRNIGFSSYRLGGPLFDTNPYSNNRLRGDEAFSRLASLGAEVMYTAWIEGSSNHREDYPNDTAYINTYIQSITKVLKRYGPNGDFWKENPDLVPNPLLKIEIQNEPNFNYMYPTGTFEQKKALYAKLLYSSYTYIRTNWPEVKIVGFGAGGDNAADKGFIDAVLNDAVTPQAVASFDILSTHPYMDSRPPDAYRTESWGNNFSYSIAESLYAIRNSLGSSTFPVWYTEIGWQISKGQGGTFNVTENKTVSRMMQAAYVCRMYAWALRLGVERVHLMFTKDSDGYNGGIFENDGTMRESAIAIKTMISLMPRPKLKSSLSDNVDGFCAYTFKSDFSNSNSTDVMMVWNGKGTRIVNMRVSSGNYRIISMLGAEKSIQAVDNVLTIEVGAYPIYIIRIF